MMAVPSKERDKELVEDLLPDVPTDLPIATGAPLLGRAGYQPVTVPPTIPKAPPPSEKVESATLDAGAASPVEDTAALDSSGLSSLYGAPEARGAGAYPELRQNVPRESASRTSSRMTSSGMAAVAAQTDAPPSYDELLAYRLQMEEISASESDAAAQLSESLAAQGGERLAALSASSAGLDNGSSLAPDATARAPADVDLLAQDGAPEALVEGGEVKYVRCTSCSQWLQVPAAASMVFCPLCESESECTDENTRRPKKKGRKRSSGGLFSCFPFRLG